MPTTDEERLAKFENMMAAIQRNYDDAAAEMNRLKSEGKEKTVTFRTLYKQMLSLYEIYGLR